MAMIVGTDGPDQLHDTKGNDTLYGGLGEDTFYVSSGHDTVHGDGTDTLMVSYEDDPSNSVINLQSGSVAGSYSGTLYAGQRAVAFDNISHFAIHTGGGNDNIDLRLSALADTVYAGAGDDFVQTLALGSVVDLGSGVNGVSLNRSDSMQAIHVDLVAQTYDIGGLTGALSYFGEFDSGSGNDFFRLGPDQRHSETIFGGAGDDTLQAVGSISHFDGGAGNDMIIDDQSSDIRGFFHANEADPYSGSVSELPDGYHSSGTIFSSVESVSIIGTRGADIYDFGGFRGVVGLDAGTGNDSVTLPGGSSTISGGAGSDSLTIDLSRATDHTLLYQTEGHGGANDGVYSIGVYQSHLTSFETLTVLGSNGGDAIDLSAYITPVTMVTAGGPDLIYSGSASDSIVGGLGDDTIYGGSGNDTLFGGSGGTPQLDGPSGSDVLYGGDGQDSMYSGDDGPDSLYGGSGADTLEGSKYGASTLYGGSGADLLIGGLYSTTYYVDNSGDIVRPDPDGVTDIVHLVGDIKQFTVPVFVEDVYYDGTGVIEITLLPYNNATLHLESASGIIMHGTDGNDGITGYGGTDSLYGGMGADTVYGGGGNDYIKTLTGEGPDTIDGGDGTDLLTIERTDSLAALTLNITAAGPQSLGDGSLISNIEQLRIAGGSGADSFTGGGLDDVLKGNAGDDTLAGGGGSDILQGGAGHDMLSGGDGADVFRFDGPNTGADTITDFQSGVDRVALSASGFSLSSLSAVEIVEAGSSYDPGDGHAKLIVDPIAHTLSWEDDRAGAQSPALLAHGDFTTNPSDYTLFA